MADDRNPPFAMFRRLWINARSRRPAVEARPACLPTCAVRGRDLQRLLYVETGHY